MMSPERAAASEGASSCNFLFGGFHPEYGDYYTRPKKDTEIFIERVVAKSDDAVAAGTGMELFFGEVSVTEHVIAFQRVSLTDHEPIDIVSLEPDRLTVRLPSFPAPRRGRPRSG